MSVKYNKKLYNFVGNKIVKNMETSLEKWKKLVDESNLAFRQQEDKLISVIKDGCLNEIEEHGETKTLTLCGFPITLTNEIQVYYLLSKLFDREIEEI